MHTFIETVAQLQADQMVWPQWMADATAGLEPGDKVEVIKRVTPFGSYVMSIKPVAK